MNSPQPVQSVLVVPAPAPAIPWYRSPVQVTQVTTAVSAAIAIFPKLGKMLGLQTPGDVEPVVEAIFGAIAVLAPILGSIVRSRSRLQPLTLTKAGAEEHPATALAAQAVTQAILSSEIQEKQKP